MIDSPAINLYIDAAVLGGIADGAILVIDAESTRREVALQAKEALTAAKLQLLGAALNKRSFPIQMCIRDRSQAIQVAGGLKDGAKASQVILFRSVSNDWVEVKKLNVKHILAGKDVREDVHLRPGDMFIVPKSTFASISPYIPRASLGTYFSPANF